MPYNLFTKQLIARTAKLRGEPFKKKIIGLIKDGTFSVVTKYWLPSTIWLCLLCGKFSL